MNRQRYRQNTLFKITPYFLFIFYYVHLLNTLSILTLSSLCRHKFVQLYKVRIFREGHKILQNLHLRFVLCSQIYGGDFARFCGLLRIYKLYVTKKKKESLIKNWLGKSTFYNLYNPNAISWKEISRNLLRFWYWGVKKPQDLSDYFVQKMIFII